ncbi:alpha-ribazole phosphatase family protein [Methylococcus sp. Mc7]|uniref:alpha-ribazole phosphatase family protein n=1 Tax=Methylococcus sp. Mc7 TaxID=2860258 RepID=UPI001C5309FE|nr:alpha-ribazole phosphatase family protein [Methylococcus sp. Mc7]QXP82676.1 alpha-ribazole phosphatase family protein [Methylococcus sp. Mc7]
MSRVTIDLLRHGEVDGGLCLGRGCDVPLNARGWLQLRAMLPERPPWTGIATSPLRRCAEFAGELAGRLGLELRVDERFSELGFGEWEGRPWSELYDRHGEQLLDFQRRPDWNPALDGEHYPDFERRVAAAWEDLLGLPGERHWLVVTHAGTIRAILRRVLEFPTTRLFGIDVPPACLSRIVRDGEDAPRLVFHGGRP